VYSKQYVDELIRFHSREKQESIQRLAAVERSHLEMRKDLFEEIETLKRRLHSSDLERER
jgi:hypothetical protein